MSDIQRKPYYANMSTVVAIDISGKDLKNAETITEIDKKVEAKVKEIIDKCSINHTKFEDPDFGPTASDPLGALSLYGPAPPNPAGQSKYPDPKDLRWDRPQYENSFEHDDEQDDTEEEDEFSAKEPAAKEVWCTNGQLFLDSTSSNDVIQGKLGDCWFLGALAVMGAHTSLLQECFWRKDKYKEFGIYVCRFFKDCYQMYVIIDDRIPVFDKNGLVVFGQCKDPNELWVPVIEKAYAKLHGCYKALIGGYSHFALADMTGYSPRMIGLKPGVIGYSDELDTEEVWKMLLQYREWNSLMGTSIQPMDKGGTKVGNTFT